MNMLLLHGKLICRYLFYTRSTRSAGFYSASGGRRDRDHMVVGFTTTYAINQCLLPLML